MRRYLVVANQTVSSPALDAAIRERLAKEPAHFHVVVPCTGERDIARYFALVSETLPGYVSSIADAVLDGPTPQQRADQRLTTLLDHLGERGATGEGEVGDEDPMVAIGVVIARNAAAGGAPFDEILLSTLPASISRWISMDLPNRVKRKFALPVVHVETSEHEVAGALG